MATLFRAVEYTLNRRMMSWSAPGRSCVADWRSAPRSSAVNSTFYRKVETGTTEMNRCGGGIRVAPASSEHTNASFSGALTTGIRFEHAQPAAGRP